ncbi:MAG: winged helix-turn-helix transcriptional regulator [Desulfovibrionaceae bacterium]|jgi:DNA-binding MarR family transcriptional regulator|nr:winged helix-turn-helix transcriptional regulator [Desulfovibrionaceae bacterium]
MRREDGRAGLAPAVATGYPESTGRSNASGPEGAQLDAGADRVLTDVLVEFYEKLSSWEHGVVRGKGVTLPQMHAVEILGAQGPLRMKELAGRMGVTTGTMTVVVDKLEARGLAERRRDARDRRVVFVELTARGSEYFAEHDRQHRRLTAEITAALEPGEAAILAALLAKAVRAL